MEVLADLSHLRLRLAEVCGRLGVTSGSFYHCFDSWTHYKHQLIEHWKSDATTSHLRFAEGETDPHRRIAGLVEVALSLDHRLEASIRAWSCADPDVRAVQVEVDALRHQIVLNSALEIIPGERDRAKLFADAALYLVVGFEQATLEPDLTGLDRLLRGLLGGLGPLAASSSATRPTRGYGFSLVTTPEVSA
jgi:hypothetical protein